MWVKLIFQNSTGFPVFRNDVLLAWELIFRSESSSHAGETSVSKTENQVPICLSFVSFLLFWVPFWMSLGSVGALLEPLSFLWRAGLILLGAFGLPGPSVCSYCYFFWCLWLVWAVCGLSVILLG